MTDLNAGLEFGFLSSLVNISFPPSNSLLFLAGSGAIAPNNDPPDVVFSEPVGFTLPGGGTEFKLIESGGHVGPITAASTTPVYCGSSVTYQGVTFNWMVVPAKTALSATVSFNPGDLTQYAFIYVILVSRPKASSFSTKTFQVPVPADPSTFYYIYQVNFSGKKGANFIPAYGLVVPAVQNNPTLTTPIQTGPDLNLTLQQEGLMGAGGPADSSFSIAYDPTIPSLTITPDQGWFV